MTHLYDVERRLIDAWDRMTEFCPKCEHGLDRYPAWEDMAQAVTLLREYHYPIERWHDDHAVSESMEHPHYVDESCTSFCPGDAGC